MATGSCNCETAEISMTNEMTTRSNRTSLTVYDLIQNSELISKGQPARYQLLTTKSNLDEDGSVRKWTFGQRDVNMKNKILLMVGETGTGKTTLINTVVNYILGVKFTDNVWFEITEEGAHMSDQSKSQTTEITVYEVFVQNNPIGLTIIDTPGYGDTRGGEYDKKIAENLYKLFHSDSGVKDIDAVCLVVKASETRLSDRQEYIFDAVLSLFGKDIENNIVIFFTHSNGMAPKPALNAINKARIPCRKNEQNKPDYFLFDNLQTEERSPKHSRTLQKAWERTEGSLNHFFASLNERNRKSLEQTERVLIESNRLEACISNLQNRIEFAECKSKELTWIQKALQQNKEKIKSDENFTFTVTTYYTAKVPIENASWGSRKATSCSICKENCHEYNCSIAWNAGKCYVMKDNYCTVCTGKCHYSKHVREKKKYVTRSREETMTFKEIKGLYESNDSASDIKFNSKNFQHVNMDLEKKKIEEEQFLRTEKLIKEDLTRTEREKSELVEEASTRIMKLFKNALKKDSVFIVQSLDFLIPRAEETGKRDYAEKLRKLRTIPAESEDRVGAAMVYGKVRFSEVKKMFMRK